MPIILAIIVIPIECVKVVTYVGVIFRASSLIAKNRWSKTALAVF